LHLLYIPWHFPLHLNPNIKGASLEAEEAFKIGYPAVYNHLLKYKKQLVGRNQAETGIRYEWYALQRWGADYWNDFEKPKIIWGNMSILPSFCVDINKKTIICAPANMITSDNQLLILYLAAFLNSQITYLFMSWFGYSREGGYFEYKKIFIEKIPIPILENEKPFSILVKKIINNKSLNLNKQDLEIELNEAVYNIYGLTETEINYIKHIK
jgi:adenine-specific DNA-methyltransferase